ncbi:MAG: YraN family protein [Clostridia bacterium]|nr:YraN family protein [Clostridia bacterium]
MTSREFGNFGESVACRYLEEKGYKIVARNYYVKGGELDVVAENGKVLAIVEVKTRYSGKSLEHYGRPAASVDRRKQNAVARSAKQYLFDNPTALQPRLDVIEVTVSNHFDVGGHLWYFIDSINHIENAFMTSSRVRFGKTDRRLL